MIDQPFRYRPGGFFVLVRTSRLLTNANIQNRITSSRRREDLHYVMKMPGQI